MEPPEQFFSSRREKIGVESSEGLPKKPEEINLITERDKNKPVFLVNKRWEPCELFLQLRVWCNKQRCFFWRLWKFIFISDVRQRSDICERPDRAKHRCT